MKGCDSLRTFQFTVVERLRIREAEMTFWTFLGVVFMTPSPPPPRGVLKKVFNEGSALRSNSLTLLYTIFHRKGTPFVDKWYLFR